MALTWRTYTIGILVLWSYTKLRTNYSILFFAGFFLHCNSLLVNQTFERYFTKFQMHAFNSQGKASWIRGTLIKINDNELGRADRRNNL